MKKTLLKILMLLSTVFVFGQNIPFKFKNKRGEKIITNRPDLAAFKKEKDSDNYLIINELAKLNKDSINSEKLNELIKLLKDSINFEKLNELPKIERGPASEFPSINKTNYYTELANKFENLYNIRISDIDELYSVKRKEIFDKFQNEELDERNLKKLNLELEELDELMLEDKKSAKGLLRASDEMAYKGRISKQFQLFPVRNSTDAQLYYDYYSKDKKSQFLKNSIISFSSDGGKASLYNELFADYFGPIRFGIGALISNKETKIIDSLGIQTIDSISIQKDAVQRLLGGGGNVSFNISYPLFGYQNNEQNLFLKIIAAPKFAFDVPKLGTENKDYSLHADIGIEGSIFYTGVLDVLTFYGNFRVGMVSGNKLFYEYLNKENDSFLFNQTSLGIALNSTFRISWNYYWGDSYVTKNFPSTISFTIVPN